ncbi:hypothetical protein HK105_205997 [Polyrhizophydium stewartii]|uniref:DUF726-domain-containing protein n=1 Tax=Polyrhizophydium stewartii TaxID=2732419 RepID=A0ABR4N4H3_9FUNG
MLPRLLSGGLSGSRTAPAAPGTAAPGSAVSAQGATAPSSAGASGQGAAQTLPPDLLFAYIGLVWLLLQEQERSLEATFADWRPPGAGSASASPGSAPGASQASRASVGNPASFWHDPLGLRALINNEDSKRHPAVRGYISWKTRLMDGLLSFNHLSAEERAAIAELSEYGVSVDALSQSLHSSIQAIELRKQSATGSLSSVGTDANGDPIMAAPQIPTTKDTSYTILYNLVFTALKNVVAKTKELRYDARLRVLLRRFSYLVFDATMSGAYHDAREKRKIKCLLQQEIEQGVAAQIWSEITGAKTGSASGAQGNAENAADSKQVESQHALMSWQGKLIALGAATVGGGIFIGITGGMAAPLLSAGLGSLFSYAGMTGAIATGIVEGLGTAGGAMAMATLFGITGGSTTAYSLSRRLKDLQDMDLKLVFDHHPSLHVAICVSGFLLSSADVTDPWTPLPVYTPFSRVEALQFETACLLEVGTSLFKFWEMYNKVEQLPASIINATPIGILTVGSRAEAADTNTANGRTSLLGEDRDDQPDSEKGGSSAMATGEAPSIVITSSTKSDLRGPGAQMASSPLLAQSPSRPRSPLSNVQGSPNMSSPRSSRAGTPRGADSLARSSTAAIPKPSMLTSLVSAIAWPVSLLQSGYIVDSPWALGMDRAVQAGVILAKEILLARLRGHRPVTLVGFSLGALTIFRALLELARAGEAGNSDAYAIVDSVYFLGMPAPNDPADWIRVASVINGRWVNAYAPNDWMLQFLYRSSSNTDFPLAGLAPVPPYHGVSSEQRAKQPSASSSRGKSPTRSASILTAPLTLTAEMDPNEAREAEARLRDAKWVENVDVSSIVEHHLHYLERCQEILDFVGFEQTGVSVETPMVHSANLRGSVAGSPSPGSHPLTLPQEAGGADPSGCAGADGGSRTDLANPQPESNEVLFENPFAEEDVVVRGIHASGLLAADDPDHDHDRDNGAVWTRQGVTFGRMPKASTDTSDAANTAPSDAQEQHAQQVPQPSQARPSVTSDEEVTVAATALSLSDDQ